MQSPTSKDKGLIGMPLQIGTSGGTQSENPSCIRVSGNLRASSEHPLSILRASSERIPRSYQGCPEARVSPCASFPVSSCVSSIVSHLVSHHVSRNHLILADYSEYAESQDNPECLECPQFPDAPEYPENSGIPRTSRISGISRSYMISRISALFRISGTSGI